MTIETKKPPRGCFLRGKTWWISYALHGQLFRETANTNNLAKAKKLLRKRRDELGCAREGVRDFVAPVQRKITVNQLLDAYVEHYKFGHKSGRFREVPVPMQSHLKHAREFFGMKLATQLREQDVLAYRAWVKGRNKFIPNASINRPLQLLIAAYRYGIEIK